MLGLSKEESCVGIWKFSKFLSVLGAGSWNESKIDDGGWKLLSVLGACGWNESKTNCRGWNGAVGGGMNDTGEEGEKKGEDGGGNTLLLLLFLGSWQSFNLFKWFWIS